MQMTSPPAARNTPPGMRLRAIAAMLALAATPSHGLWLGEPLVRSHLGEPLRVDIPYRLEEGESIDDRCLGLGGQGVSSSDGLDFLLRGRVRLVEYGLERSILITSQLPQGEPVVKVRLQVDCGAKANLARDYLWLLDPPAVTETADSGNVPPLPPVAFETAAAALPSHSPTALPTRSAPGAVPTVTETPAAPSAAAPSAAAPTVQSIRPTIHKRLVAPGETLADIARELAPQDEAKQAEIVRTIIALNAELFSGTPANSVNAGTELIVPDTADLTAIATTAAVAVPHDKGHRRHAGAKHARRPLLAAAHRTAPAVAPPHVGTGSPADSSVVDTAQAIAETKRAIEETRRLAAGAPLPANLPAPSAGDGAATRREGNFRFSLTLSHFDPTAVPQTPAQRHAYDEAAADDRQATILSLREQIKNLKSEIASLQALAHDSKTAPAPAAPVAGLTLPPPPAKVEPPAAAQPPVAEAPPAPPAPPKVATPPKRVGVRAHETPHERTDSIWETLAHLGLPASAIGALGLGLYYYRRRRNNVEAQYAFAMPPLVMEPQEPLMSAPPSLGRDIVEPKPAPTPVTESALEFIPPPSPAQDVVSREQRRAYLAERFPEVAAGVIELHDTDAIVEASRMYFEGDGDTDKAIELLEFSIADDPPQIKLWLAEFEILRRANRAVQFDKLATRYRLQFGENEHWHTVCVVGLELDPENRTFQAGAVSPPAVEDEWGADDTQNAESADLDRHENWLNAPLDFTPELLASDLRDSLLADFREEETAPAEKDEPPTKLSLVGEDQAVNG